MDEQDSKPKILVNDRRFWVIDENAVEGAPDPVEKYPTFVEELKARAELAESRLRQRLDELAAENDAYRSRLRSELERRNEARLGRVLGDFLEIVDNLERAFDLSTQASSETILEGLQLNIQLFLSKLREQSITPLQLVGQPYQPEQAEAVGMIPVSDPEKDGVVLEEIQKGYLFGDQLLRPARVRIGKYETGEEPCLSRTDSSAPPSDIGA